MSQIRLACVAVAVVAGCSPAAPENEDAESSEDALQVSTAEELPAGAYTFTITGTGDADLFVRRGAAPTDASYDCSPQKSGSSETCTVTLAAPAPIHVWVRSGDGPDGVASTFTLVGKKR